MIISNSRKILIVLFSILLKSLVFGQTPEEEILKYSNNYPNQSRVVTQMKKEYRIKVAKNQDLDILLITEKEIINLSDYNSTSIVESIYQSGFNELVSAELFSTININGKYKKTKIELPEPSDELGGNIFHDDFLVSKVEYNGLTKGSKVYLRTVHKLKDPFLLRSIRVFEGDPIDKMDVTVEVDKNVDLDFKYYNFKDLDNNPKIKSKSKKVIYTWNFKGIKELKVEEEMPSFLKFIPEITPIIKSYKTNGKEKKILGEISALHNWYQSFLFDMKIENDKDLNTLTDSLVAGSSNPLEKMEAIYSWVQENIRYIAFEAGYQGFRPREPHLVFKRLYGDCKDNSSLLVYMLNRIGIPTYYTWVGTRKIPYTYLEKPTPEVDNHMIATSIINGQYYFLDGTSRILSATMPPEFIQGKEALIHLKKDSFEVVTIPIEKSEMNQRIDSMYLSIKDQSMLGTGSILLKGYNKSIAYEALNSLSGKKLKERFEYFVKSPSNKFKLQDYNLKYLTEKNRATEFNYEFKLDDYITQLDNELYVNLNFNKTWTKSQLKEDREYDYVNKHTYSFSESYVFEIPKDYIVDKLPEDLVIDKKYFSYSCSYSKDQHRVYLTIEGNGKELIMPKTHFNEWNNTVKRIKKKSRETIVLKKK
jgi:hypothetical protein